VLLTVVVLLIVLWILGYVQLPGPLIPDISLFAINGHTITLVELCIFLAILWAVGILPTPLRQIGVALVLLWVLATLGIIAIAGLSSMLVIAIIVGLIATLFGATRRAEPI
jgi:hypothetical protein